MSRIINKIYLVIGILFCIGVLIFIGKIYLDSKADKANNNSSVQVTLNENNNHLSNKTALVIATNSLTTANLYILIILTGISLFIYVILGKYTTVSSA
ncbi:MAG: hypothetical protein V1824_03095 [archaeon]